MHFSQFDPECSVNLQDPFHHHFSGWLLGNTVYKPISINRPILPFFSHCSLDCLINAHVHGLRASCRDVDHLNSKRLNTIHDVPHHVDTISIKNEKRNYTRCLCVLPQNEHIINPVIHRLLIHPCFRLT